MALSLKTFLCFCTSILFIFFALVGGDDEFDALSQLLVEHSFDSGSDALFHRRGTITIRSLKSGVAHFSQDSGLSQDDKEKLKLLASENGLYRVRVQTKTNQDDDSYVMAYVRACSLYESRLSDILTVNVDLAGNVLGVSMKTTSPHCHGLSVSDDEITQFNTSVDIVQTVSGPSPETQTYIEKIEQERTAKAKGGDVDNRSFIQKYWFYLVVAFVVMMMVGQGGAAGS